MRELIRDAWSRGWWDRLLLMLFVVIILLGALSLWALVSNRLNRIESGTVSKKLYQAPFVAYVGSGKTHLPVLHAETFSVIVTNGDRNYYTDIPEALWQTVRVGDRLNLTTMEVEHGYD